MSQQNDARPGVAPLKTVGHPTPRIDAVERVTGTGRTPAMSVLPGMLYARVLRSPHPHARIRSIDVSKARALPGVKAILTHENCHVVWGAGSIAGGQQYNDEIKKITKQRRYAFNNPVRFVGEPVAAVAAVDRHVAEEALALIAVDYEVLPFVLDQEEALKPDAPKIWPEGNLVAEQPQRGAADRRAARRRRRGAARRPPTCSRIATRPPSCTTPRWSRAPAVAHWDGDKLTVYTPTGGIANCRHDMARDLGMPDEKVRVVCQYMGGNFGNKNQNQDADLIAAMLAKEAGAPVKLEFSRKEDFIGVHGRWPTMQYYKVGVPRRRHADRDPAARLQRHGAVPQELRDDGRHRAVQVPEHRDSSVSPVYTNRTVSANFRGPEYPQGFFGIQSMMDDVAYQLKIDPVEFALKNMTRMSRDETPYTNYTLEECIRRGAELFDWKARWRPTPGSDPGPIKRGAGMTYMLFRSGLGRSSAVLRLDARGRVHAVCRRHRRRRRRQDDDGTDCGRGARCAAVEGRRRLGRHRSLSVLGRRIGQPHDDHDRHGRGRSRARPASSRSPRRGCRPATRSTSRRRRPARGSRARCARSFGAHFVRGRSRHGAGRRARHQVRDRARLAAGSSTRSAPRARFQGAVIQGIGMALHEDLVYDRRSGQPLTAGYYGARIATHLDAPTSRSSSSRTTTATGRTAPRASARRASSWRRRRSATPSSTRSAGA